MAIALLNLGDLARAEGDQRRAGLSCARASSCSVSSRMPGAAASRSRTWRLLAAAGGSLERSAQLFGAAEAQRDEAGAVLPPVDRPEHDRAVATITLRVGPAAVSTAWAFGRSLTHEAALALAQRTTLLGPRAETAGGIRRSPSVNAKSPPWLPRGLTNKQIADTLVITKQTADKHVGNILGNLGVGSRAQVAVRRVQQSAFASTPAVAA